MTLVVLKYGGMIPSLDWFRVMTYLVPSSVLLFIHLFFINRDMKKQDEVQSEIWRVETNLSNKHESEINKTRGLIESFKSLQQEKDTFIKELKEEQDIEFSENEKTMKEDIEKAVNDMNTKLNETIDKSGMKEFSQNIEKLNKGVENIERLKKDIRESDNYNKLLLKFLEGESEFIQTMIKTVKYNKKQKEDIENKLRQLNRDLTTLKGEEYKRTLKQQQRLKGQQGEYEVIE